MTTIFENDVRTLLEECIYKYASMKYVRQNLENNALHFSSLKDFNDAYEEEYRLVHYFKSIEDEKTLLDLHPNALDHVRSAGIDYLRSLRVTCFSRTPANNLMWAHYSAHHKGICYCFKQQKKENPIFGSTELTWGNIVYSTQVPTIKVFQEKTTEGMVPAIFQDVVLTKPQEWLYEQEVRCFGTDDSETVSFHPPSLKAILVGRRASNETIEEVAALISAFNKREGASVRLLFAHRVQNSYSLGIHSRKQLRDNIENATIESIPVLKGIDSKPLTSIDRT